MNTQAMREGECVGLYQRIGRSEIKDPFIVVTIVDE